jgi:NTP pyrophosphatase (non-canonical NTP hydrolase)
MEKLKHLYAREIDRRIDPVATVSELDEDYVQKEIDEYFFTDTLFEHLHTFLDKLASGTEGRTGVWINGYYGSGKSHFLKYIYYCLSDTYGSRALKHFSTELSRYERPLDQPIFDSEVEAIRSNLEQLTVDPVMFNIKTVADEEADKRSVTKVFYNRLNAFRGYNKSNLQIAAFEKTLDGQGKLAAFKEKFRELTGDRWEEKANRTVAFNLRKVLDAAEAVADIDRSSTRSALERSPSASPEGYVDELEEFLSGKPDDYRLVYLVDEVSQFTEGRPHLLADLQSIVEEIGDRLGDQVWVVCTAQQKLERLIEDAKSKQQADYSFGKIMGRFETFLPLESQQADQIARKRVLDKNPEGAETLREYFEDNEAGIRNQFERSDSELYSGYQEREQFVANYPFVPYQFKLITEVIQAFERADFFVSGVSSTERSLIGNTHEVAQACMEEEVGYFVPFDLFYNAQIADHLTNHARSIINNALQLDRVERGNFAERVVKALFLVSNLREDQSVNFPATAENIAFVLIDEVDPNWAELKQKTQEVLDYFVEQNVVSESEGTYRFLQEEEIRVKKEIDNHQITQHDRVETFATEVLEPVVKWNRRVDLEGTSLDLRLQVDNYQDGQGSDAAVQIKLTGQESPQDIAIDRAKKELVFCLYEHFGAEQRQRLDEAVRIQSYLQDHLDSATDERYKAMTTFQKRSRRALDDLQRWLKQALLGVRYVSAQQVFDAGEHSARSAKALYETVVSEHLHRIYDKRDMATRYAGDRNTLRREAQQSQTDLDETLTPAETEVNNYLSLATRPTVAQTIQHFQDDPYGWKDHEIIHILLRLRKKQKRIFQWNSEEVEAETFVEKAVRRRERSSLTIHEQEDVDPELMHEATEAINHTIFNESLVDSTGDPRRLAKAIRGVLSTKREEAERRAQAHNGRPFGRHFEALADALRRLERTGGETELFEAVVENAEDLQATVDLARNLADFWERNRERYQDIADFVRRHRDQKQLFDGTARDRLDELQRYIESEDRPHGPFPSMLDYYEAVSDDVREQIEDLRSEVAAEYEEVFDELEEKADALDVDGVVPDRSAKLDQVQRLSDLGALQGQLSQVSDFRAQYVKTLNDRAQSTNGESPSRQSEVFDLGEEASRDELKSEDDVEAFVDDLRTKLLDRVRDDKIVILK